MQWFSTGVASGLKIYHWTLIDVPTCDYNCLSYVLIVRYVAICLILLAFTKWTTNLIGQRPLTPKHLSIYSAVLTMCNCMVRIWHCFPCCLQFEQKMGREPPFEEPLKYSNFEENANRQNSLIIFAAILTIKPKQIKQRASSFKHNKGRKWTWDTSFRSEVLQ